MLRLLRNGRSIFDQSMAFKSKTTKSCKCVSIVHENGLPAIDIYLSVPVHALVVRHRVGQANSALLLLMLVLLLREVDAPLQFPIVLPLRLLLLLRRRRWRRRGQRYPLRKRHISERRLSGGYGMGE